MFENNSRGKALQHSYVEWLKHHSWTYLITLHFKADYTPSKEVAEQRVRNLCTRLNRYLNGTNPNIKLSAFSVAENSKSGVPHIHLFLGSENEMGRCINEVKNAISYYWSKLRGCVNPELLGEKNSGWFKHSDNNTAAVISYMCKELLIGNDPVLIGALNISNTK